MRRSYSFTQHSIHFTAAHDVSCERRPLVLWLLTFCLGFTLLAPLACAQNFVNYMTSIGNTPFSTTMPVQLGFVDLSNGNMHLTVPLGSWPQRGNHPFSAALVYDSRIWQQAVVGSSLTWQPTNVPNSQGGWRFVVTPVMGGTTSYQTQVYNCNGTIAHPPYPRTGTYLKYYNFQWTDPYGTVRMFPISTILDSNHCVGDVPTGNAYAIDSSGYKMTVSNHFSQIKVVAPDGSQVFPSFEDTNGNQFSKDSNGNVIDTLGRTPVVTTPNCNGNSNQTCYDVLNSQGTTSRYILTTQTISVATAFGASGVTEYSGNITVAQSIQLPDTTTYQFTYDNGGPNTYGELTSVTLPTGGSVSNGYTTFVDGFGNRNRWVNSYTAGTGTWNYAMAISTSCASGFSVCQTNTVTKPSGDVNVYTFGLNNGAWASQIDTYTGPSVLLSSVVKTWNTSNSCPLTGCTGAAFIQQQTLTTIIPSTTPSTLYKATQLSYLSRFVGDVTQVSEWNFYVGTQPATPDRTTTVTYNGFNEPLVTTVMDGAQTTTYSKTSITYDSYGTGGLTALAGATQHDDTNYGVSNTARGNPTSIQRLVTGTGSTYLTSSLTYDTTGQVLSVTDPAGNTTNFSYVDSFYDDNDPDPNSKTPGTHPLSTPTNAYLTQITQPLIGSSHLSYYFGTGQVAIGQDPNGALSYGHYYDAFSRPTSSLPPVGWSMMTYPSSTEVDSYSAVNSATASTGCASCQHAQVVADNLGRPNQTNMVNNPDGATTSLTVYDNNGRVQSASLPYRTTLTASDTVSYDGLDRTTVVTHLDMTYSNAYYGAGVTGTGVNAAQLCSSATYGLGYPSLFIDEAGKRRENWTDGFGRLIEVDEPDSTGALTVATCDKYDLNNNLTEVDQGVQTRTYTYDALSRTLSATIPEATQPTSSNFDTDPLCTPPNSFPGQLVSTVDARGVRTCFQYDALGRPTKKAYTVVAGVPSTAPVIYNYDAGGSAAHAFGRLTSMTDGVGSETYTYDVAGRVTHLAKVIDSVTYGIDYTYDLAGDPLTIGYPASGHVVSSGYDAIGRLCGVGASVSNCTVTTPIAQTFTYNAVDQVTRFAYGNTQVTAAFAYSPKRSQLTSIAYTNSTSTLLGLNYFYAYDSANCPTGTAGNNGQIQCVNDVTDAPGTGRAGRSASYTYDQLGRLSTAQTTGTTGTGGFPQWGMSWDYDRYGNRKNQNVTLGTGVPASSLTFAYPGGAQTNHPDGFSFDAGGNMLNDGVNTLTYDAENHVTAAAVGSTTTGEYVYDGNGLRVKKCVPNCSSPTTTTRYIFSGSSVIAEYENGAAVNSPTREYLYAGALKIATVDTATTYHLRDHLSVRVNTNSSGNLIGEQGHYPFGDAWYLANTTSKEQFTTYERDPETGNDYAMARFSGSRLGRFYSVDPLSGNVPDPQSLNRYAYVTNDPINLADPFGMDPLFELGGPAHGCTFDAYFGVSACGDMCEARVSSSCNESGGGGGFYLSININFAFPSGGGPFGESSGIPYGVTPPPFSLFNLLFGGNQQCEFGGFCPNSFGEGDGLVYSGPNCTQDLLRDSAGKTGAKLINSFSLGSLGQKDTAWEFAKTGIEAGVTKGGFFGGLVNWGKNIAAQGVEMLEGITSGNPLWVTKVVAESTIARGTLVTAAGKAGIKGMTNASLLLGGFATIEHGMVSVICSASHNPPPKLGEQSNMHP